MSCQNEISSIAINEINSISISFLSFTVSIMTDLMQIISNGAANIKLEITGEDLRVFSDKLIDRAINEVALAFRAADEERLLSREEVKDMCGVCDATLWHWNKRNYLKAVKVGSKVRYRLSDVKRILGGTNKTVNDGSK